MSKLMSWIRRSQLYHTSCVPGFRRYCLSCTPSAYCCDPCMLEVHSCIICPNKHDNLACRLSRFLRRCHGQGYPVLRFNKGILWGAGILILPRILTSSTSTSTSGKFLFTAADTYAYSERDEVVSVLDCHAVFLPRFNELHSWQAIGECSMQGLMDSKTLHCILPEHWRKTERSVHRTNHLVVQSFKQGRR